MYAEKARTWNSKKRSQKTVKEVNAANGTPSIEVGVNCIGLCVLSSTGCCASSTCSPHPPASGGYGCSTSTYHYTGYAGKCSGLN